MVVTRRWKCWNVFNQSRQCVIDCNIRTWHSDTEVSAKYEHYKHFKSMLNVEQFISLNLPFYLRKAIAKIKFSNHKLKFSNINTC